MEGSSGQTNASGNLDLCGGGLLDWCFGFLLRSASDLWVFGVWTSCTVGVSGGSGVS